MGNKLIKKIQSSGAWGFLAIDSWSIDHPLERKDDRGHYHVAHVGCQKAYLGWAGSTDIIVHVYKLLKLCKWNELLIDLSRY